MYFSNIIEWPYMKLQLLKSKIFDNIPSGSGIEKWQDKIYIIGDDSNFLFELNNHWKIINTIQMFDRPTNAEKRIVKKIKPDLEAMTLVPPSHLLAIGSGSLPEVRDVGVLINLAAQDELEYLNFNDMYEMLRSITSQVNIEGACNVDDKIVLLNRGDNEHSNQLIITNWNRKQLTVDKQLDIHFLDLPQIENVNSGFTGCVYLPETDLMIFCASAEETSNAYDDGKIKGSMLGLMENFTQQIAGHDFRITATIIPDFFKGKKIESVCIDEFIAGNEVTLLTVADNDNGKTELMRLQLSF
jgi:hypothetical protein